MEFKTILTEKVSQKGNKYYCLEVYLTDNYKKVVFLDASEVELINIVKKSNNNIYSLLED